MEHSLFQFLTLALSGYSYLYLMSKGYILHTVLPIAYD